MRHQQNGASIEGCADLFVKREKDCDHRQNSQRTASIMGSRAKAVAGEEVSGVVFMAGGSCEE